jgi:hypothetical protein
MAQLTLDMDDDTLTRMRGAAEAAGLSLSAWLVLVVRERTMPDWPRDVLELAGSWKELETAEELRAGYGADVPRESF